MVFVIGYRAIEGEEIDMHVVNRHEDGNLAALVVEILVFHHLLVGGYHTIGGSQNSIFFNSSLAPYRDTEKADGQHKHNEEERIKKVMPHRLRRPKPIGEHTQRHNDSKRGQDGFRSLFM